MNYIGRKLLLLILFSLSSILSGCEETKNYKKCDDSIGVKNGELKIECHITIPDAFYGEYATVNIDDLSEDLIANAKQHCGGCIDGNYPYQVSIKSLSFSEIHKKYYLKLKNLETNLYEDLGDKAEVIVNRDEVVNRTDRIQLKVKFKQEDPEKIADSYKLEIWRYKKEYSYMKGAKDGIREGFLFGQLEFNCHKNEHDHLQLNPNACIHYGPCAYASGIRDNDPNEAVDDLERYYQGYLRGIKKYYQYASIDLDSDDGAILPYEAVVAWGQYASSSWPRGTYTTGGQLVRPLFCATKNGNPERNTLKKWYVENQLSTNSDNVRFVRLVKPSFPGNEDLSYPPEVPESKQIELIKEHTFGVRKNKNDELKIAQWTSRSPISYSNSKMNLSLSVSNPYAFDDDFVQTTYKLSIVNTSKPDIESGLEWVTDYKNSGGIFKFPEERGVFSDSPSSDCDKETGECVYDASYYASLPGEYSIKVEQIEDPTITVEQSAIALRNGQDYTYFTDKNGTTTVRLVFSNGSDYKFTKALWLNNIKRIEDRLNESCNSSVKLSVQWLGESDDIDDSGLDPNNTITVNKAKVVSAARELYLTFKNKLGLQMDNAAFSKNKLNVVFVNDYITGGRSSVGLAMPRGYIKTQANCIDNFDLCQSEVFKYGSFILIRNFTSGKPQELLLQDILSTLMHEMGHHFIDQRINGLYSGDSDHCIPYARLSGYVKTPPFRSDRARIGCYYDKNEFYQPYLYPNQEPPQPLPAKLRLLRTHPNVMTLEGNNQSDYNFDGGPTPWGKQVFSADQCEAIFR